MFGSRLLQAADFHKEKAAWVGLCCVLPGDRSALRYWEPGWHLNCDLCRCDAMISREESALYLHILALITITSEESFWCSLNWLFLSVYIWYHSISIMSRCIAAISSTLHSAVEKRNRRLITAVSLLVWVTWLKESIGGRCLWFGLILHPLGYFLLWVGCTGNSQIPVHKYFWCISASSFLFSMHLNFAWFTLTASFYTFSICSLPCIFYEWRRGQWPHV